MIISYSDANNYYVTKHRIYAFSEVHVSLPLISHIVIQVILLFGSVGFYLPSPNKMTISN